MCVCVCVCVCVRARVFIALYLRTLTLYDVCYIACSETASSRASAKVDAQATPLEEDPVGMQKIDVLHNFKLSYYQ